MRALPVPPHAAPWWRVQSEQPPHRRVQAVRGHQMPCRHVVDQHVVSGVHHLPDRPLLDRDAGVPHRRLQRPEQRRTTYAPAGTRAERRVDGVRAVDIADAVDPMAVERHAEVEQVGDRRGHQALAARLVDDPVSRLVHLHVQAGPRGVQRCGESDRSAPGHHQVAHQTSLSTASSAAFSTRSRTVSRATLATVKTTAVTQAACTRGRAAPSTTTAT